MLCDTGCETVRATVVLAMLVSVGTADSSYEKQVEQWRVKREARLKSENGWLTLAGLFWLKDGQNTVGTATDCSIVLPLDSAPAHLGTFRFQDGKTAFKAAPGLRVTINDKPAESADLRADDSDGGPDIVAVKALSMYVIHRGDKYAIRLKDRNSEYRRKFTGLHWYPIRPEYRVTAKFIAWPQAQEIPIANILGQTEPTPSPGYLEFTLNGVALRLDAVTEDDTLFLIFRDKTAGKTTYGAGRFLNTAMPKDGKVELDFNEAYNPPCAFTPYATCPLPPPQNRLAVAVEAGEKKYGDH